MNEYIKTAQAIAELPKEAGCDRWTWRLVTDEIFGLSIIHEEALCDDDEIYGPWLNIDDLSEWSAAKWLERAGVELDCENEFTLYDADCDFLSSLNSELPTNLDYMKAILAIGQRAFGTGEWETGFQEERQPWLEAWERGQNINQAE
jgi:hypothetical protein